MKSVIVKDEASAMSLAKEMKNGPWVVLYYAEWCGHCSHMKPEWNKFKSSCNKNVNIGEVEHSSMDLLHKRPEIKGYPTIRMYNNNTTRYNLTDKVNIANDYLFPKILDTYKLNNNIIINNSIIEYIIRVFYVIYIPYIIPRTFFIYNIMSLVCLVTTRHI